MRNGDAFRSGPGHTGGSNRDLWLAAALALLLGTVLTQLALGADVFVLSLSVASVLIGFAPILRVGLDLYTVFAALFCLRYTGVALFAKTLYLQPVDSLLKAPLESYALVTVLIACVSGVCLLVRRWDRGTTIFPPLPSYVHLRQVGLIAYGVGAGATLLVGLIMRRDVEGSSAGALTVIASALTSLMFLGYAAEVSHTVAQSGARRLFSSRLIGMLACTIALALFLNARAMAVNSVLCVFLCGLMFRAIKPGHLLVGAALAVVFTIYISPLALELRTMRGDKSAAQFASDVVELVARTVTEPHLIGELQQKEAYRSRYETGTVQYDYFGDGSNILNRAAFVGLLDSVYSQVRVLNPIGIRAITEEVIPRNLPSFLVEKAARPYGFGDWLSWEIGLIEVGRVAYLSSPIPVEGIAVFGPLVGGDVVACLPHASNAAASQ
jgi:hypothetical protein